MAEIDPPPGSPREESPQAEGSAGPAAATLSEESDELADIRRLTPLLVVVLALVVVAGVTDLVLDRPATWRSWHVAVEATVILVSLGFAVVLWRGWRKAARALDEATAALARTTRTLAERQRERDAWRRSAEAERAGFGRVVDAQFAAWGLTPTEREVASLLLQGLGHKQIAGRSGRSERTVRQHAVAIYEKSGLGGRAELAAFFLHDLLPEAVRTED